MIPLKRHLLILAGALLIAGAAQAAADPLKAQELVRSTSETMLETLRREKGTIQEHPEKIYALVQDIALPHFDFDRMSRWVMGKHWRRADAAQQARFVEEFRTLLVRTYATALAEYSDTQINYLPMRGAADAGEVTVKTEAEVPGGLPVPVDYSLYLNDKSEWKVYDVAIDGLSLVTNYRSTFANEIRAKGIDGLLSTLAARNKQAER